MIYNKFINLKEKFQKSKKFLTIKPFDITNNEGVENERYRRAILTTFTSITARVIGLFTGIISVPLTISYLGIERYGMWMTISSVLMLLVFADLGLGNGLINELSKLYNLKEFKQEKKLVSSVFFLLIIICFFLLIFYISIYSFVPWEKLLNVKSELAIQESGPAFTAFWLCFIFSIPSSIAQKIQTSNQEGYVTNFWQIGGNILSFIALVIAIILKSSLSILIICISGVPAIVMTINCIHQFYYERPYLRPNLNDVDWKVGKIIVKTGFNFVILTITFVIGTSSDSFIIAQYLGPEDVAAFAIIQKLFSITFIVQLISIPFWPVFNEAISKGEFLWAQKTFNNVQKISIIFTIIICLPLLIFGQEIISFWASPLLVPSFFTILGFALFRLVSGFAETPISLMMGSSLKLKKLIQVSSIACIISIVLKFIFIINWGLEGIVWSLAIGYGVFFAIPIFLLANKSIKKQITL